MRDSRRSTMPVKNSPFPALISVITSRHWIVSRTTELPLSFGPSDRDVGRTGETRPWPVTAKALLSNREKELYQKLRGLYPGHQLFIQVALSQLINVTRNHPESVSTRNRIDKLVADFVLCRQDLGIVAVIELDDRTHLIPRRQAADTRKTKALRDAGLRLVRIPAGPLPSENKLRELIEGLHVPLASANMASLSFDVAGLDFRRACQGSPALTGPSGVDDEKAVSYAIQRGLLRLGIGVTALLGGWLLYALVMPRVVQHAFQNLAPKQVAAVAIAPQRSQLIPPVSVHTSTPVPLPQVPNQQASVTPQRDQAAATLELIREKQAAWNKYYQPPTSCDHPIDWSEQVECGNRYMRAKKSFDLQWAKDHPIVPPATSDGVFDSLSMRPVSRSNTNVAPVNQPTE